MKVTVVGQWTIPCRYDKRKLRGNTSSIIVMSDPAIVDEVLMEVVGFASEIYVIDHVRRHIGPAVTLREILPVIARSEPSAAVRLRSTPYKILKTVDIDASLLSNYEAFVNAVDVA